MKNRLVITILTSAMLCSLTATSFAQEGDSTKTGTTVGLHFGATSSQGNSSAAGSTDIFGSTSGVAFAGGLFIDIGIIEMLKLETGFFYDAYKVPFNEFGVTNTTSTLGIPLIVQFQAHPNFNINAGVKTATVVGNNLKSSSPLYTVDDDSPFEDLSGLNLSWVIGFEVNTNSAIDLGVRYQAGLSDLYNPEIPGAAYQINALYFYLGLRFPDQPARTN